jgi:hypothetical protein
MNTVSTLLTWRFLRNREVFSGSELGYFTIDRSVKDAKEDYE